MVVVDGGWSSEAEEFCVGDAVRWGAACLLVSECLDLVRGVLRKELGRVMGKGSGLGFAVCLIFKEFLKCFFRNLTVLIACLYLNMYVLANLAMKRI